MVGCRLAVALASHMLRCPTSHQRLGAHHKPIRGLQRATYSVHTMFSPGLLYQLLGHEEVGRLLAQELNKPRWQEPPGMVWNDVQEGEFPPEAVDKGQWCIQCSRKFRGGPEDAVGWQWARNPKTRAFRYYVVRCACCNPGYDCPHCATVAKEEGQERKREEVERQRDEEDARKREEEARKQDEEARKREEAGRKRQDEACKPESEQNASAASIGDDEAAAPR